MRLEIKGTESIHFPPPGTLPATSLQEVWPMEQVIGGRDQFQDSLSTLRERVYQLEVTVRTLAPPDFADVEIEKRDPTEGNQCATQPLSCVLPHC